MSDLSPVSVAAVVATYNDLEHLPLALNAILGQTTPPGEVIVADDQSDDGTDDYMNKLVALHEGKHRIKYLKLSRRSGVEGARRAAIEATDAKWIASCDSDDLWSPNKLERQIDFINRWAGQLKIVVLGTHGLNINNDGRILSPFTLGMVTEDEFHEQQEQHGILWLAQSSVLFDRHVYDRVGGYRFDYQGAEDVELWSRMSDYGLVITMPEQLIHYRKRAGSMQQSLFWRQQGHLLRISENHKRRAAGVADLSAEEFHKRLAAEPVSVRLRRRRHDLAKYYYRRGSVRVVNHKVARGVGDLLISGMLDTRRVFNGVAGVARHIRHDTSRSTET